ncbi:MAG TPA: DUF1801 domain-containing protein [Candidatus Baltobacteraceae bacterium]|nr:DUF1801 domain-containing protein [Candidatus Baltobacteraceae bacterium]
MMRKIAPVDFDDYARHFPKNTQKALLEVRSTIRKAAPQAEETISYNLPAFAINDEVVVWFAAFKSHIGFYPGASAIAEFKADLAAYKTAKGSIQFPLRHALPVQLIRRIVKFKIRLQSKSKQEKVLK